MFRLNAPLRKRRPSSPPISGGEETYWEGRRDASSCFQDRYAACPGPRPGLCWPAGTCPARRSRMGGEEESARTGDSNPGCNYLVRGYSPSMHFFWGGDMPHYSPPLPFSRALCGVPRPVPQVTLATQRGDGGWMLAGGHAPSAVMEDGRARTRWPAGRRARARARRGGCGRARNA